MEHLGGKFGRPPFRPGGDPAVGLTAILEPQRLVAEQAGGAQLDRRLGQRKRYAFEAREGRAEGLALGDIVAGLVDALLRHAEAHQADQRAAEVEPLHHLDETNPLFADPRRRRDPHTVEEELAAADRARPQILEARAADPG